MLHFRHIFKPQNVKRQFVPNWRWPIQSEVIESEKRKRNRILMPKTLPRKKRSLWKTIRATLDFFLNLNWRIFPKTQNWKKIKTSELFAETKNVEKWLCGNSLRLIFRTKRRKSLWKTKFEKLCVGKKQKQNRFAKKNPNWTRKKSNEISNRFLNKNRTLNSGLAPLRVLRIFGKLSVKPKFVYICEVPSTNAATAGQAGGTLSVSSFRIDADQSNPRLLNLKKERETEF